MLVAALNRTGDLLPCLHNHATAPNVLKSSEASQSGSILSCAGVRRQKASQRSISSVKR